MAVEVKKVKTYKLQINRLTNSKEPNKAVYIPVLESDRIVLEFQCVGYVQPTVSNLMELVEKEEVTIKIK
jgi:hypothetical protein